MAESWKSLEQCPVFQHISGIRYSVYSVGNNIGKQNKKKNWGFWVAKPRSENKARHNYTYLAPDM